MRGTANLFITGITIQVLWVFFLVLPTPVYSHDAVANYALKAKIFFQSGGIPTGFFAWPESQVAHSDYPLFLPLLMTWIYEFTGFNDLTVNLIMPCIYVVFLGAFYAVLRRFFGIMYSLLSVFLLATIPQLFDYATIIHSDLLLTVFVSCACLYMMVYIRSEDKGSLIISSFLFGIALWIKNEAIVFAAAFLAVILISFLRKEGSFRGNRWGTIVSSFLPLILIAIPWFAVKFYTGTVNSDIDMTTITATGVWENIKDIPILLNLFQQEVFGPKKWNIFWVLFFSVLIWKRRSLWKKEIFYLTTFLTIAVAGYFTGYMITTGANIFFYVNTTISRFMLHFVGICMFYMMYLAWSDVKEAVGRMGDVR
ncbi:MAG: glycosyltransferase family 39 protein [Candidatus Omnitrophica bacterium]|nr:glycosyltransferase family 39 protein [Candidatus Omnitrophota bacterium]